MIYKVPMLEQEDISDEDRFKLIGVTCFLIASKAFERDEEIPKSASFITFIKSDNPSTFEI